jgi:hypothetical protein
MHRKFFVFYAKNSSRSREAFLRGGSREIQNREIEVDPAKIGGGNAAGVAPGRFSNLSDVTNTDTMMKRE